MATEHRDGTEDNATTREIQEERHSVLRERKCDEAVFMFKHHRTNIRIHRPKFFKIFFTYMDLGIYCKKQIYLYRFVRTLSDRDLENDSCP